MKKDKKLATDIALVAQETNSRGGGQRRYTHWTTVSPRSVIRKRIAARRSSSSSRVEERSFSSSASFSPGALSSSSLSSLSSSSSSLSSSSPASVSAAPRGISLDRAPDRKQSRKVHSDLSHVPPKSSWPTFPVFVRVSPGCPTHIINGHAGTSSDEGSPRKGVDIICKVSLSIMRAHLDKFLSPCEVLPRLSYSQWIAALHPESVITSSAGEQGEPTIDERMFHRMSEHLTMWNAHPLVTEDQRIVPKNSTILSESKNVLEKEDDNKFFEDRNIQEDDYTGALSINDTSQPIEFETELFKGVAMIRINLENCDFTLKSSSDESYFSAGRKRKMQVCVQGRFKRPLRFDQVYSGQEFSRPLKNVPAKRLVRWGFSILKPRLPPSFRADLFCPQPYFLSPLILTSSRARCDWPSKEPNVTSYDFEEDFVSLHLSEARFQKSATQVVSNTTDQMEPVSIHPPLSKRNTRLKVRNVKNQLAAKERKKQQAILKAEKAAKAAQEFQAIAKLS